MKTYAIDIRYYVNAENEQELNEVLKGDGVFYSEYYCGYKIVDVEDDE